MSAAPPLEALVLRKQAGDDGLASGGSGDSACALSRSPEMCKKISWPERYTKPRDTCHGSRL